VEANKAYEAAIDGAVDFAIVSAALVRSCYELAERLEYGLTTSESAVSPVALDAFGAFTAAWQTQALRTDLGGILADSGSSLGANDDGNVMFDPALEFPEYQPNDNELVGPEIIHLLNSLCWPCAPTANQSVRRGGARTLAGHSLLLAGSPTGGH
jgi:hypothetical protein